MNRIFDRGGPWRSPVPTLNPTYYRQRRPNSFPICTGTDWLLATEPEDHILLQQSTPKDTTIKSTKHMWPGQANWCPLQEKSWSSVPWLGQTLYHAGGIYPSEWCQEKCYPGLLPLVGLMGLVGSRWIGCGGWARQRAIYDPYGRQKSSLLIHDMVYQGPRLEPSLVEEESARGARLDSGVMCNVEQLNACFGK